MEILSLLQLLPPLTPKWFRFTAHIVPVHWHFGCRQNSARKRKIQLWKTQQFLCIYSSEQHTEIQILLWILHTFTFMNCLKLYKCKSIRGCYFEIVVLFNEESFSSLNFFFLHIFCWLQTFPQYVHNSSVTEHTHLTPAPTATKTICKEAPFKPKYSLNLDQLLQFLPEQTQRQPGQHSLLNFG